MSLGRGHYTLAAGEGETFAFLGSLVTVKAGSEQTDRAFGLIEQLLPAGYGPPPHIHHMEDESFYVLEGTLHGTCGDETWTAGPGSFVWLPRGVAHGFTIDEGGPVKMLQLTAPSGFERFVADVGEPWEAQVLPAPAAPDVGKLVAAGAKLGIELLPPPGA